MLGKEEPPNLSGIPQLTVLHQASGRYCQLVSQNGRCTTVNRLKAFDLYSLNGSFMACELYLNAIKGKKKKREITLD
jgi:hypothetical protein